MREILFRGKRVDNGEWVGGCFIYGVKQKKGKSYILPENIDQPGCHHLDGFEVIPESVGQFTGLFDKNGKEIYEGDLAQHDAWDYPFEVIFNDEKARFVCKLKTGLTQYIDYENLVVVGDVY